MSILFAAVSGILGALAFPKMSLWPLAFVFLVPFFVSLYRASSLKRSALLGLVFGLVYFGIIFNGISELYLYVSLFAYLGWLFLITLQSLFIVVFSVGFKYFVNEQDPGSLALYSIPAIWVILEWARALGPFGVGGGAAGYALVKIPALIQIASVFGLYAVSFIVVWANALIFKIYVSRGDVIEKFRSNIKHIAVFTFLFLVILIGGWYRVALIDFDLPINPVIFRAALIQGNIPQLQKLDPSKKDIILDKNIQLTKEILVSKPDLVIWPETAVSDYLFYDKPALSKIASLIKGSGASFIIGAPEWLDGKAYNSAFAFNPEAKLYGRYDKQVLVPFGEYLPFKFIVYPVLASLNSYFKQMDTGYDSNARPKLLEITSHRLGALICFESTLPGLVLNRARMGADAIVVLTNDAWFGESSLVRQHLDVGIMRAVEVGLPLLQAANTGFSALILANGKVYKVSRLGRETALVVDVPVGRHGTLYLRWGDIFVLGLIIYVAAIVLLRGLSSHRPEHDVPSDTAGG